MVDQRSPEKPRKGNRHGLRLEVVWVQQGQGYWLWDETAVAESSQTGLREGTWQEKETRGWTDLLEVHVGNCHRHYGKRKKVRWEGQIPCHRVVHLAVSRLVAEESVLFRGGSPGLDQSLAHERVTLAPKELLSSVSLRLPAKPDLDELEVVMTVEK